MEFKAFRCGTTTALALRDSSQDSWVLYHGSNFGVYLHGEELSLGGHVHDRRNARELFAALPDICKDLNSQRVSYKHRHIVLSVNSELAVPADFDTKRDMYRARFETPDEFTYHIYIVDQSLGATSKELVEFDGHVGITLCGSLRLVADPSVFERRATLYPKAKFLWHNDEAPTEIKSVCLDRIRSGPAEFDGDRTVSYHDQFRVLIWTNSVLEGIETYDDIVTREPVFKTVHVEEVSVINSRLAAVAMLGELIRLQDSVSALQEEIGPVMSSLDDIERLYSSNEEVSKSTRLIRSFLRQEKIRIQSAYEALLREFKVFESDEASYELLALKNIMPDLKSLIKVPRKESSTPSCSPRMFSCPPPERRLAFRDLVDDL